MPQYTLVMLASLFSWFGVNWDAIDARIEREFPGVPFIEQSALAQTSGAAPLLFDVREPEEFAVSHLPGAHNLDTARAIAAETPDKAAPIVVYCSVGYRSAAVAAELQALGYENVRNLRHSIFGWANSGLPLVNAAGPTDKVHPYNAVWGSLVDSALRSYSPANP